MTLFRKLLFLCSSWMLLNVSLCLNKGDQNVCRNESTGALYCCFNYEMNNGQCVECKIGYTSRDGEQCQPCREGLFGDRCLRRCYCSSDEMCDKQMGCVKKTDTPYSPTTDNEYNFTSNIGENKTTILHEEATIGITDINKDYFAVSYVSERNEPQTYASTMISTTEIIHDKKTNSNDAVKVGIPVGVLVLYIFIVHILCFLMYIKLKKHRTVITHMNLYDEIGTVHYNAVLIPPITDPELPVRISDSVTSITEEEVNLTAVIDQEEINSESSDTSSDSHDPSVVNSEVEGQVHEVTNVQGTGGYEHPYTQLVPTNLQEHHYNEYLITSGFVFQESEHTEIIEPPDYIHLWE